jgi:hypothetical protein
MDMLNRALIRHPTLARAASIALLIVLALAHTHE